MNSIKSLVAASLLLASCSSQTTTPKADCMDPANFSAVIQGENVELFTITGGNIVAQVTNYGARLVTLFALDRNNNFQDVVWGYDSIDAYLSATDTYAGPIVGRYGNRIDKGRFSIDDVEYQTTINNGENHLHGGTNGFSTKVWQAEQLNDSMVVMRYSSPDGEEGYPGKLDIEVKYIATHDAAIRLEYSATTDKTTVINPTNHSYFNLNGDSSSVLEHTLQIHADNFTPTDSGLIPTGQIAPVEGTPLDFRAPTAIGKRINTEFEPLTFGKGYDHNWIFSKQSPDIAQVVLYSPTTGIEMSMYTDQPAVQFYSGNFMDGVDTGKRGDKHNFRTGVAIEAQGYPDAPNHAHFPSTLLTPGEEYTQVTTYTFQVK